MSIQELLELWRSGRRRLRSEEDYRSFQASQCGLLLRYIQSFGLGVSGQLVLDLGSGVGGYAAEMARSGARVLTLDLVRTSCGLSKSHSHIVADALSVPLQSEAVDFVFCASLIEHVGDPRLLLNGVWRVLKTGGCCYLSFPPFYSPRGGHQFSPFHYLGEHCALRLARHRAELPRWVSSLHGAPTSPHSYADSYGGWGLGRVTIAEVRRLVSSVGFETLDISTRYVPLNTACWPVLGEILTWHVQFLLRKP